jgi:transcription elongation factor SPT6
MRTRKMRKMRVLNSPVKGEKSIIVGVSTANAFIHVTYLSHILPEETLEDDDLDLLEENTRGVFRKKNRLAKLRHLSRSPASSKRHTVVESSDDDLDTSEQPRVDISKIWDDDRDEDEDIDDFIDYSDEDMATLNQAARDARREEKRQELRRKRAQVRPELVGIDAKFVCHPQL